MGAVIGVVLAGKGSGGIWVALRERLDTGRVDHAERSVPERTAKRDADSNSTGRDGRHEFGTHFQ